MIAITLAGFTVGAIVGAILGLGLYALGAVAYYRIRYGFWLFGKGR